MGGQETGLALTTRALGRGLVDDGGTVVRATLLVLAVPHQRAETELRLFQVEGF